MKQRIKAGYKVFYSKVSEKGIIWKTRYKLKG